MSEKSKRALNFLLVFVIFLGLGFGIVLGERFIGLSQTDCSFSRSRSESSSLRSSTLTPQQPTTSWSTPTCLSFDTCLRGEDFSFAQLKSASGTTAPFRFRSESPSEIPCWMSDQGNLQYIYSIETEGVIWEF